jgi:hypothetical protein
VAQNPTTAMVITLMALVWTGIFRVVVASGVPIVFPIVFGIFETVLLAATLEAWLRDTTVEATGWTRDGREWHRRSRVARPRALAPTAHRAPRNDKMKPLRQPACPRSSVG